MRSEQEVDGPEDLRTHPNRVNAMLNPVLHDQQLFKKAQKFARTQVPRSQDINAWIASTIGAENLGEEERVKLQSVLEDMSECYDRVASFQRLEIAVEQEEIRKGTPLPSEVRLELIKEERARSQKAQEQNVDIRGDADNEERNAQSSLEAGVLGSEMLAPEECIEPGIETDSRGLGNERVVPMRVSGVRNVRFMRLQPGADADAVRDLVERTRRIEQGLQDVHDSVRRLRPIVEAAALSRNDLGAPDASGGGFMLFEQAPEEARGQRPKACLQEADAEGGGKIPSQRQGGLSYSWVLGLVAAAMVMGIGIGVSWRVDSFEEPRSSPSQRKTSDLVRAQRIKWKYLREEKARLEQWPMVEQEAQGFVLRCERDMEAARASQHQDRLERAEKDFQDAQRTLGGIKETTIRARKALVWIRSQGLS